MRKSSRSDETKNCILLHCPLHLVGELQHRRPAKVWFTLTSRSSVSLKDRKKDCISEKIGEEKSAGVERNQSRIRRKRRKADFFVNGGQLTVNSVHHPPPEATTLNSSIGRRRTPVLLS